ncbi:MAG: hypothetical protein ACYCOO_05790 [Chitinophagaceae bacterium]
MNRIWKPEILWILGIAGASFLVTAFDCGWNAPVILHTLDHVYLFSPFPFFIFCFLLLLCWNFILFSLEGIWSEASPLRLKRGKYILAGIAFGGLLWGLEYFYRVYHFYFVSPSSPLRPHFVKNYSFLILLALLPFLLLAGRIICWRRASNKESDNSGVSNRH